MGFSFSFRDKNTLLYENKLIHFKEVFIMMKALCIYGFLFEVTVVMIIVGTIIMVPIACILNLYVKKRFGEDLFEDEKKRIKEFLKRGKEA